MIVTLLLTCPTHRYDVVVAGRGKQCATLDDPELSNDIGEQSHGSTPQGPSWRAA